MSSTATISFEVNVADATFECQLDLEPYDDCNADVRPGTGRYSVTYTGLTVGDHLLNVVGSSETVPSNGEQEPAVYEWEVVETLDVVPPETSIERAPGAVPTSTLDHLRVHRHRRPDADAAPHLPVPGRRRRPPRRSRPTGSTASARSTSSTPTRYEDFQMAPGRPAHVLRARDRPRRPGGPEPAAAELRGQPRSRRRRAYTWTPVADTRPPMTTLSGGAGRRLACSGPSFELPFEFGGLDNATPMLELEFECAVGTAPLQPRRRGVGAVRLAVRRVGARARHGHVRRARDRPDGSRRRDAGDAHAGRSRRRRSRRSSPARPAASTRSRASRTCRSPPREQAIFTFTSDQPGSTFECSLDGADFVPCGGQRDAASDVGRVGRRERRSTRSRSARRTRSSSSASRRCTSGRSSSVPTSTRPNTADPLRPAERDARDDRDLHVHGLRQPDASRSTSPSSARSTRRPRGTAAPRPRSSPISPAARTPSASARSTPRATSTPHPPSYTWIVAPPPVTTILSGPGRRRGGDDQPHRDVHVRGGRPERDVRVLVRRAVQPAAGHAVHARR